MASQREQAEQLHALHEGPGVLVLANAWDAASARLVAQVPGCRAVATSSASCAAVLGYPDGEAIPPAEMLDLVARIVRAAGELPVTADLEAGYGDAGETAAAAIEAGAVGLNLEDGRDGAALVPAEEHAEQVRAAVAAGERAGVPLVVNARTDVYLRGIGEPETRFDEAVRRCRAYRAAGAGSLFVPGVADAETIGRLAAAIDGPLNVLAGPATPPVAELERLGVRRVSVGSGLGRVALAAAARAAAEFLGEGRFDALAEATAFDEVQRLMGGGR